MITTVPSKKYVSVSCLDCNKSWLKRADSILGWNGRCRSCAQKIEKNRPETLARRSELSRIQVFRQGGIPNRKPFGSSPDRSTKGEKNHRWRGGKCAKHTGLEYVEWRKRVYVRDGFTCQVCGQVGGKIHAHHLKSFSEFPDRRYLDDNGVTLCVPCHKEIHKTWRLMKNV